VLPAVVSPLGHEGKPGVCPNLVHGEYMPTHAYPGERVLQGVPHRFRKLSQIDHQCNAGLKHSVFAMKKELSPKQMLSIRCPTCGAAPGEKCELSTGQPRTDPHRDRRVIAKG
jgi:hypothetical protein